MPTTENGVQIPTFDDDANIPDMFKQMVDSLLTGSLYGEAVGGATSTTLATASTTAFTAIAGSGFQLPTLTNTRRIRILTSALFTMGSAGTNGYYAIGAAFQQVGSPSAPTVIRTMPLIIPSVIGPVGQTVDVTTVLGAGDWIVQGVAYRYSGGVATDHVAFPYTAAYDAGPA